MLRCLHDITLSHAFTQSSYRHRFTLDPPPCTPHARSGDESCHLKRLPHDPTRNDEIEIATSPHLGLRSGNGKERRTRSEAYGFQRTRSTNKRVGATIKDPR
ncbi:hypothetical protein YC2023_033199 [Brassica napus]